MMLDQYLAGIAGCRAVYRVLLQDAVDILPPAEVTPGGKNLVSSLTERDIATKLTRSVATVRRDLEKLRNYGWLERHTTTKKNQYMKHWLGCRYGLRHVLHADLKAEEATGIIDAVSHHVVKDIIRDKSKDVIPIPPPPAPTPTPVSFHFGDSHGRGASRKWVPDQGGANGEAHH